MFINDGECPFTLISLSGEIIDHIVIIHNLKVIAITVEGKDLENFKLKNAKVILLIWVFWVAFKNQNLAIFVD